MAQSLDRFRTVLTAACMALVLALTPSVCLAQDADEEALWKPAPAGAPSAEEVFRRYLEAIGGEEALRSHTSRESRGRMTLDPGDHLMLVTIRQAGPDKIRIELLPPGERPTVRVFDGAYGWVLRSDRRAELMRGDMLRDLADTADMYLAAEFAERFSRMQTEEILEIDEHRAYRVHVRYRHGRHAQLFFDASDGLLVGMETIQATPGGHVRVYIAYGDYREVEGVKLPFRIVERAVAARGEETQSVIEFTEIRVNPDPPPTFEQPAAISELIRRLEIEESMRKDG